MASAARKSQLARVFETYPWKLALAWLVGLAPFFFLSYGFANWITSLRHGVPSVVFGWERAIPFVPWTILPYWSTDLLYGISLFLWRTREDLNQHARRLLTAQLISIAGFLLFPLQFSFARPHATGFFGDMFEALYGFDKPFNQAPSLHLSLTVILWAAYLRHLRGAPLWLMRIWMVLVGVSTLTTFQHHFIDLPCGIWVGLFCVAAFPLGKQPARYRTPRDSRRLTIGAGYFAAAGLCGVLASRAGGAGWFLLWPAGAFLILAFAYWTGRPDLFRKRADGSIAPPMGVLIAPYLALAWLNLRYWARRDKPSEEIVGGVRLGRLPRKAERDAEGVASIVDLSAELPVNTEGIVYRSVPVLDWIPPGAEQLTAAVRAIDEMQSSRPTLVCCKLGYTRSAMALAAWLMSSGRANSVPIAVGMIQERRPKIVLGPRHLARLEEWRAANLR